MKYTLKQITDLSFRFELPSETVDNINMVCRQMGIESLRTNEFTKMPPPQLLKVRPSAGKKTTSREEEEDVVVVAKEPPQVSAEGALRLHLNKLTDKTFLDVRANIMVQMDKIGEEEYQKVGLTVLDICSANKFYSVLFADLFAELASKYTWLNARFQEWFATIMEQYTTICFVDSEKDYDGFCEMNKVNERRRAATTFYMNLALNGFLPKVQVVNILENILSLVAQKIDEPEKKPEVDELVEIIAILYNYPLLEGAAANKESIDRMVQQLAAKKSKDCASFSNKAIFKLQDVAEAMVKNSVKNRKK